MLQLNSLFTNSLCYVEIRCSLSKVIINVDLYEVAIHFEFEVEFRQR